MRHLISSTYTPNIESHIQFRYHCWTGEYVLTLLTEHHTLIEPRHEKTCCMTYANNKGADQPAHPQTMQNIFIKFRYFKAVFHRLRSIRKIKSAKTRKPSLQIGIQAKRKTWKGSNKNIAKQKFQTWFLCMFFFMSFITNMHLFSNDL